jgi:hypothetical protein
MPLDIAQIQEVSAKAAVTLGLCQANQQIGNALIVMIKQWLTAIASLADAKGSASQCKADTALLHSEFGHL